MAKMYPELDEADLKELEEKSQAEADVYRAFRDQTPPEWLVLHGLNLVARRRGAPPVDAEVDFVVFDPRRGFLAIEVKGGRVSRDSKGKWWSEDRNGNKNKIKDAIRQAATNKYQVLNNLDGAQAWGPSGRPRLLMGHAGLFPDLGTIDPLIGPDRPREILGARSALERLSAWVDGIFNYWAYNDNVWTPLGARGMAAVQAVYCAPITTQPLLALAIRREQERQIELTRRQTWVLQNLRSRARAAIAGAAGTGKTLLALQHARALALQGRRTLLICYTRALADFLKREAGGITNLEVEQFHQLCQQRISAVKRAKGIDLLAKAAELHPTGDLYRVQLPYAVTLSADQDSKRYQAILVDEGQDLTDEQWFALELLLEAKEDAQFYIFYDPNQAIYQPCTGFNDFGYPLLLTENCRNTEPVHEAAYRYYKSEHLIAPPDIKGEPITQLAATGLQAQASQIRDAVSDLLVKGGLKPEDIAVLLAGEPKDAHFRALNTIGEPTGARWSFEKLWQPGGVLVDTVRRFKGLEAAAVIVWCAENVDPAVERELMYVALSRARNRLWLVSSAARLAKVLQGM